ncbi:MAG: hypothetical protein AAAC49_20875, partial [Rhizobium leguminosarum]
VRLQDSAEADFRQGKAIGEGHTSWYVRADRLCPGGKMPGPPAALLRHAKQWVRPAILSLADLPCKSAGGLAETGRLIDRPAWP